MQEKQTEKKKRTFQVPDTYVIIFFLTIFAIVLTLVLPAGSYQMVTNEAGQSVVDPNSFTFTPDVHLTVADVFCSLYNGLKNGANTIFLVLIIGGVFQIVLDTGTIEAVINVTVNKLQEKALLIFPFVMVLMSFLGALGVGINVALAFIPIGVALCKKFRLDPIVAVAMFYLSSNTGFSASPVNPFTVLLAQDLSGVQYMSGFGLRLFICCLITVMAIVYVMRYSQKIRKDPSASIMQVYQEEHTEKLNLAVTGRQLVIFVAMAAAFAYYTWGAITYDWDLSILSGCLVALGLFAGIVGRMNADAIAKSFVAGCKSMVYSAVLVGFAGAISVVMTAGGVIHSIVYYLCIPLASLPAELAAVGMYVAETIIAIFIPSGSGQAYVTIPLMAPMADVLGFSRQIAILAFQFADGFTNAVPPTTSLLMGCLGVAGVPYQKWLRFSVPLFGAFAVVACVTLVAATMTGWA